MNLRYGLAACGVIAALAVSVAGCSSGGPSTAGGGATPNTSGGASSAASGTVSSAAAAATGGASPSWAAALGAVVRRGGRVPGARLVGLGRGGEDGFPVGDVAVRGA